MPPPLAISLARSTALFDELARIDGVDLPWRAVETPVLRAFAADRQRYWNVLEPSLKADAHGLQAYRFSYGLPGFRADVPWNSQVVRALAQTVGGAAVEAADRFLRAVAAPCVEQPLVGFARDPAGAPVLKLYLQFRDEASEAARRLTAWVLSSPRSLDPVHGGLHMLGLDVRSTGLFRAKLYELHPVLPWSDAARSLAVDPDLVPRAALREGLLIYEVRALNDPTPVLTAVDFAMDPQRLSFSALAPRLARIAPAAIDAIGRLGAMFSLHVRRVSIGAGAQPTLTLYYVLTEPSAGG